MTISQTTWSSEPAHEAAAARAQRRVGLTFRAIGIPAVVAALAASAKSVQAMPAAADKPCASGRDMDADERWTTDRGAHD